MDDYISAMSGYQNALDTFQENVDRIREFDKDESRKGAAISMIADPLGAHLLTSYGGPAISGIKDLAAEGTQQLRQIASDELGNIRDGISKFISNKFGNLGRTAGSDDGLGADPTFGDVQLQDFVSDPVPATEEVTSGIGRLLGLVRSAPDINNVLPEGISNNLATMVRQKLPTFDVESPMDLTSQFAPAEVVLPDIKAGLSAGGETAISSLVKNAGAVTEGVSDGLEATGEAIAGLSSETVIGAIAGAGIALAGILEQVFDHNKNKIPQMPNISAPEYAPGFQN